MKLEFRNIDHRARSRSLGQDRPLRKVAANHIPQRRELGGRPSRLVDRGIVIVAGGVRHVGFAKVSARMEAERSSAINHVQADGYAPREHPVERCRRSFYGRRGVFLAPGVEPSRPKLAAHAGTGGPELGQIGKFFLRLLGVAKVDGRWKIGQRSARQLLLTRSIGRIQLSVETGVANHLSNGFHIAMVGAEGPVFVLHLNHQNRSTVRHQQRRQALPNLLHISRCGGQKFRIVLP